MFKIRIITTLTMLAGAILLASNASAVTVKIKKTYANGLNENPAGSKIVEVNSPLYISNAFDLYGYNTNITSSTATGGYNVNEVIFEDSETYKLIDDIAGGAPTKDPGPILLGFGTTVAGGFGDPGAGGVWIHAPGQNPTIDISGMSPSGDSWGINAFMHIYQTNANQPVVIEDINFINTTNYGGDGGGYSEALIRFASNFNAFIPVFRNCTFDINFQILAYSTWSGGPPRASTMKEFDHCAVRVTEDYTTPTQLRKNLVIAFNLPVQLSGDYEFDHCTFIGDADKDWSVTWGTVEAPAYKFNQCVAYNMHSLRRYNNNPSEAFNNLVIFPGLGNVADPTTLGSGIVVEDPEFTDSENSFTVQPGSPADKGGGSYNYGWDLLVPVELSEFNLD